MSNKIGIKEIIILRFISVIYRPFHQILSEPSKYEISVKLNPRGYVSALGIFAMDHHLKCIIQHKKHEVMKCKNYSMILKVYFNLFTTSILADRI